jgi:hypothetical protein
MTSISVPGRAKPRIAVSPEALSRSRIAMILGITVSSRC